MVDAMRKQLDALMGTDRNGEPTLKKNFTDNDVCSFYMVGLCPHELFNNTKMDMGDCPKIHSVALKADYEESRKKKDFGFEYDLEMQLQKYVEDCDRKIKRNQRHLEDIQTPDPEDKAVIQQVKDLMDAAERLGAEGKVEESLEYIAKAEELKNKKIEMTVAAASIIAMIPSVPDGGPTATQHQKLRICSAYLSLFDSDKRLSDHFGGKLHIGYLTLREKYKELKENRLKQRVERQNYNSYNNYDRSSYYDRRAAYVNRQVSDIDDSFERDLERIRQRQREKQRREQEEQEPDRDASRDIAPPPRRASPPVEDYEPPRRGRRERIDYDRPPTDYDLPAPSRDFDRPPRNYSRERIDYDRPPRDFDRPRPPRDYDRPPRDYDRPPRDYDRPPRDYDQPPRDYDQPPRDQPPPRDLDYDRPVRDYDRPERDYDRPARDFDRPTRDYDNRDRGYGSDKDDKERDYDTRDFTNKDYDRPRDPPTRAYADRDYDRPREYERGYEREDRGEKYRD